LSATQLNQLDHFSSSSALPSRWVDDVLDADSSTATLGKTAGKDARNNKPTYVSALGLERARDLARELRDDALHALDLLPEKWRSLASACRLYRIEKILTIEAT